MTPAEDRYAMVEAALEDRPDLEPSRLEIDRGGPSYTVDTVHQLLQPDPRAELFVVVGADVVAELDTWHETSPPCAVWSPWPWSTGPGRRPAVEPPAGWQTVPVPVLAVRRIEHRAADDASRPEGRSTD